MLRHAFKKPLFWIVLLFSTVVVAAVSVNEADTSREYHLKAAFLRYVAKFVTWPETAMDADHINICLLGDIPSLKGLNSINGRVIEDRSILVRPIKSLEKAHEECQILYITDSEKENLGSIIETFDSKPILTFGDMEGFAELGGAMNFYIVNNRMAIMINQETVAKSQLTIHPRMLRLVTIVPNIDDDDEGPAADEAA